MSQVRAVVYTHYPFLDTLDTRALVFQLLKDDAFACAYPKLIAPSYTPRVYLLITEGETTIRSTRNH